jgi:hypothetical protein
MWECRYSDNILDLGTRLLVSDHSQAPAALNPAHIREVSQWDKARLDAVENRLTSFPCRKLNGDRPAEQRYSDKLHHSPVPDMKTSYVQILCNVKSFFVHKHFRRERLSPCYTVGGAITRGLNEKILLPQLSYEFLSYSL